MVNNLTHDITYDSIHLLSGNFTIKIGLQQDLNRYDVGRHYRWKIIS